MGISKKEEKEERISDVIGRCKFKPKWGTTNNLLVKEGKHRAQNEWKKNQERKGGKKKLVKKYDG